MKNKIKEFVLGLVLGVAELFIIKFAIDIDGMFAVILLVLISAITLPKAFKYYKGDLLTTDEFEQEKIKLDNDLRDAYNNKASMEYEAKELEETKNKLNEEIEALLQKKSEAEEHLSGIEMISDTTPFPQTFEFSSSEAYMAKLKNIKNTEKQLISSGEACTVICDFTLNGRKSEGNSLLNKMKKLMLLALNIQSDIFVKDVTYTNYETKKKQLIKAYESINNLSYQNMVMINSGYLDLKLQELEVAYLYKAKKEEEKEILREERERQREEAQARKEIQAKQKAIDLEVYKLKTAKDKLNTKILSAKDDEINLLREQLAELEEKIAEFEDDKKELDYRLENTGAGYVYVISNIGSFGERVFKIGVTRRLDPYERIAELSSASVPFRFDVHAMIFSYEAYTLETELHNHFSENKVNKVNNRKEFFNVDLSEIKKVLDEHKELTFDYIEVPPAIEYRETLRIEEQK